MTLVIREKYCVIKEQSFHESNSGKDFINHKDLILMSFDRLSRRGIGQAINLSTTWVKFLSKKHRLTYINLEIILCRLIIEKSGINEI